MARRIAAVFALVLTAGAIGTIDAADMHAPAVARVDANVARAPIASSPMPAGAMLVLAAADPDRGKPLSETDSDSDVTKDVEPDHQRAKVLPPRDPYADLLEITLLMAAGFALGLGAFALRGIWAGVATSGLLGVAVGAAGYSFLFSSSVSQPSLGIAAALLIFSVSALAPNLFGRAGLAAARRLFGARRARADKGRRFSLDEKD